MGVFSKFKDLIGIDEEYEDDEDEELDMTNVFKD